MKLSATAAIIAPTTKSAMANNSYYVSAENYRLELRVETDNRLSTKDM